MDMGKERGGREEKLEFHVVDEMKMMGKAKFVTIEDVLRRKVPRVYVVAYIGCIIVAVMSDWLVLAETGFGMYLKVFTLGGLALALLYMIFKSDYKHLKDVGWFGLVFSIPLLLVYLLSLWVWSTGAMEVMYISRGTQKMIFQAITVISVISGVWLFGAACMEYLSIGLFIAYGLIIGYEAVSYGIPGAIQEALFTIMGNTEPCPFMIRIELHDVAFAMGIILIYYTMRKPKVGKQWMYIAAGGFFFLMGYKRIAIAALAVAVVVAFWIRRRKDRTVKAIVPIVGIALIFISFGFVIIITNGTFAEIMNQLDIEMSGRDRIYKYMAQFYEISPEYQGYGFEYTVALLRNMRAIGEEIIHVTGIHNDILKQYIEMGFWGFIVWMVYTYVFQMLLFGKRCGRDVMILCFIINLYAWITYMTDNTIYYFWLSTFMRCAIMSATFAAFETPAKLASEDRAHVLSQAEIDLLIGE